MITVADKVRTGDLKDDDLKNFDPKDADQRFTAAEGRVQLLLMKTGGKGLKADNEEVKKALADLDQAIAEKATPNALYLRGELHLMTGDRDKATKDFKEGLKQAKDEQQKERFQAKVDELAEKAAALQVLPGPHGLAVLLACGFQPPADKKDEKPKEPLEAAPKLAEAIRHAGKRKYKEAIEALDEAKKRHDARRFLRPNKPQNPLTDPREESFLRCCDEIKKYWQAMERLGRYEQLASGGAEAVDELIKKAEAAQFRDAVAKLVKDKEAADKLAKANLDALAKHIEMERTASADRITGLEKAAKDDKKKIEELQTKLATAMTELTSAQKAIKEGNDREKALALEKADALAALGGVGKMLGVNLDSPKGVPNLLKRVQEVKSVADMKDPKGDLSKLVKKAADFEVALKKEKADAQAALKKQKDDYEATLKKEKDDYEAALKKEKDDREAALKKQTDEYQAVLKERWEPAQMLDFWQAALQGGRERKELAASARKDVERVQKDAKATELQQAKALAVKGLALRNEGQFAEARAALEKALPGLPEGAWKAQTQEAIKEAADPYAGVVEKAEELAARGKTPEALALMKRSLDAPGLKKGPLLARRGLIALEAAVAQARGKLAPDNELVKSASDDAAAAVKENAAEGHYLAGRIAEATGDLAAAEKAYREAVKASPAMDDAGLRYKVALARVLARRGRAGGAPRPVPVSRVGPPLDALSLVLFGLYAPGLPEPGAPKSEAMGLADEIDKLGDKAPFDVRAQALAIKGLHSEAIRVYVRGLLAKGLLAPRYANDLGALVEGHPLLRQAEGTMERDPIEGEKHYGAGLNHFFAKRYSRAEGEFRAAIRNDNGDARYYYFLGLAQLAQGSPDARETMAQAAKLERAGRPDRIAVARSLERVQGAMRRYLNEVRSRPVK